MKRVFKLVVILLFIAFNGVFGQYVITESKVVSGSTPPLRKQQDIVIQSASYQVESGSNYSISSGNTVIFKPGFNAKPGSNFRSYVDVTYNQELSAAPVITDNQFSASVYNGVGSLTYAWNNNPSVNSATYLAPQYGTYNLTLKDELDRTTVLTFNYMSGTKSVAAATEKNWVKRTQYNLNGEVIGESIQFSDKMGKAVQSQVKNVVDNVLMVTETKYDAQGRQVFTTMPAVIEVDATNSSMPYINGLVLNSKGEEYNLNNFDTPEKLNNPDAVNGRIKGSLGWYYSPNNTLESNVAETAFPYSRVEYSETQPNAVRRQSGAGEAYKMGSGHESESYALNASPYELYYIFEFAGVPMEELKALVKYVSIDAEGKTSIVYKTNKGYEISACRVGGDTYSIVSLDIPEIGYVDIHHTGGVIDVNTIFYEIVDLSTDKVIYKPKVMNTTLKSSISSSSSSGGGSFDPVATQFPAGFYRIRSSESGVRVKYNVQYTDHNLNIVNKGGKLVKAYSPLAVAKKDAAMATTYNYNSLGWLNETSSPEEGLSQFVYRKDGQIRFSQNAKQRARNCFSYTNYDSDGAPVESGEFFGNSVAFSPAYAGTNSNPSVKQTWELIESEDDLPDNECRNQVFTYYDRSKHPIEISGLETQNFVLGAVAETENANSRTWYSYRYDGKAEWVLQKITGLSSYFLLEYTYDDVLSSLTNVKFTEIGQGKNSSFEHRYTYDKAGRLTKVETRRDNSSFVTNASYYYYKHGALKRVELENKLQGIDYTYTVNGWLKSVNSPELTAAKDPGKDANDIFGMSLDYYKGDYLSKGNTISQVESTQSRYDGNIVGQNWQTRNTVALPGGASNWTYRYGYNENNFISQAVFGTTNSGVFKADANGQYKEWGIEYDKNGNITRLNRNAQATMDALQYHYTNAAKPNQLSHVTDAVSTALLSDVESQQAGNYAYNEIGEMEYNKADGHYFDYDVAGKVTAIYSDASRTKLLAKYFYNEGGFRIKKTVYKTDGATIDWENWYIRDNGGNIQTTYRSNGVNGTIALEEVPVYGTGRIGLAEVNEANNTVAYKYELADHLGNVRATINGSTGSLYTWADYYPFGMVMPGREATHQNYRFGYQGQFAEKDKETGYNQFEARLFDARLGRWLSFDPAGQYYSPYLAMGNNPVSGVDPDGRLDTRYETEDGQHIITTNDGNFNTVIVPNDKLQAFIWGIANTSYCNMSQPEWNYKWQNYMGAVDKITALEVSVLAMVHSDRAREAYLACWRGDKGLFSAIFTEIGAQWTDPELLVTFGGMGISALRSLVKGVGHTTPWSEMTKAERRAFQHSYSRHFSELGLPKWAEKNAPELQRLFNNSVTNIRRAGNSGFFKSNELVKGIRTTVNRTEPLINGQKYYYYETLEGNFISAGKMQ